MRRNITVARSPRGYAENVLAPVNLSGVLVPWCKIWRDGDTSDFKLVRPSGVEYFLISDPEWREVLSSYTWEEVKIIGLLNISNMTVIPQKVYPRGPTEERERVVDFPRSGSRNFVKELVEKVNELQVVPAGV